MWNNITSYVTGQKVTAAVWEDVVENMNFLEEVKYQAYTANVNVSATTVATANQIVSAGAITYENVPHMIEFYCPTVSSIAADVNIIIRDSTTVLGTLTQLDSAQGQQGPVCCLYRLTPSAASHTYNVAAWLGSADTVVANAGSGGTAGDLTTLVPGFIRITRVPT